MANTRRLKVKCNLVNPKERRSVQRMVMRLRLDRRRVYGVGYDGELCTDGVVVLSCSGCTETVDGHNSFGFPVDPRHGCLVGGGCEECGYTGKRRETFQCPVMIDGRTVAVKPVKEFPPY